MKYYVQYGEKYLSPDFECSFFVFTLTQSFCILCCDYNGTNALKVNFQSNTLPTRLLY